ncbi:MAG TPA: redoxin family protein [Blastocatellia bacterium]|nr:redoxin family protein [Blastocatellia bacterium]
MLVGLLLGLAGWPGAADDKPEFAPIVERKLSFYDFTLKTPDGGDFNLRSHAADKQLTIIGFAAGWCKNSNNNAHVVKRLYDKYHERGLGVVVVMEYSTPEEVRVHLNRVGIVYPVVIETDSRASRKKSRHYEYRRKVEDKRKWGTPFYVILDRKDIGPERPDGLLASRVYTVSGEIIEAEAEAFIEQKLTANK